MGANYGDTVERRLSRAALGAGLTKAAQLIRQAAPPRSRIKKSVGTVFKKNKRRNFHEAKAGLNVGKKNGTAPHAHFFVLGTVDRFTKDGAPRGKIVAMKFVRQAIQAGGGEIAAAMIKRIQTRLPMEVERLRRKYAAAMKPSGTGFGSATAPNNVPGLPVHDYG